MIATEGPSFAAHARLLTDPPLWCWEIVDAHGMLVASSWQSEWKAYSSAGEALRHALPALVKLSRAQGMDGRRRGVGAVAPGRPRNTGSAPTLAPAPAVGGSPPAR